jgi:hypothetical protein
MAHAAMPRTKNTAAAAARQASTGSTGSTGSGGSGSSAAALGYRAATLATPHSPRSKRHAAAQPPHSPTQVAATSRTSSSQSLLNPNSLSSRLEGVDDRQRRISDFARIGGGADIDLNVAASRADPIQVDVRQHSHTHALN